MVALVSHENVRHLQSQTCHLWHQSGATGMGLHHPHPQQGMLMDRNSSRQAPLRAGSVRQSQCCFSALEPIRLYAKACQYMHLPVRIFSLVTKPSSQDMEQDERKKLIGAMIFLLMTKDTEDRDQRKQWLPLGEKGSTDARVVMPRLHQSRHTQGTTSHKDGLPLSWI